MVCFPSPEFSSPLCRSLKWELRILVLNHPYLPTIVIIWQRKFHAKGPKRPHMCTIADDCARVAESGLQPPLRAPNLILGRDMGGVQNVWGEENVPGNALSIRLS